MLKFLIILLVTIKFVLAQRIDCTYTLGIDRYDCNMIIDNRLGFDDFNVIHGVHIGNRRNFDVTHIVRNGIQTPIIPSIICRTFNNLRYIDLSQMAIMMLAVQNGIRECTQLEELILRRNQFNYISWDEFRTNPKIHTLDMSINEIMFMTPDLLTHLPNLHTINLESNRIGEIPHGLFKGPNIIRNLNFVENRINKLESGVFDDLKLLEVLVLSLNPIGDFPDDFFDNFSTSITLLGLADIGLQRLVPRWFHRMAQLDTLFLSGNSITEIPSGTFLALKSLRILSIADNRLAVVSSDAFPQQWNPDWLNFDFNRISAFDRKIIDNARNFQYILFFGNVCASTTITPNTVAELTPCFDAFDRI